MVLAVYLSLLCMFSVWAPKESRVLCEIYDVLNYIVLSLLLFTVIFVYIINNRRVYRVTPLNSHPVLTLCFFKIFNMTISLYFVKLKWLKSHPILSLYQHIYCFNSIYVQFNRLYFFLISRLSVISLISSLSSLIISWLRFFDLQN